MPVHTVIEGHVDSRVVLCCEHASNHIPDSYVGLGLSQEDIADHIGWDIGAAAVVKAIAEALNLPAVLAGVSRLLIDCNRGRDEASLIVESADGVAVPGNIGIDEAERQRRIASFYQPYHDLLDDVLGRHAKALLLSVHSFTPALRTGTVSETRSFDAGVLFDRHSDLAERFGRGLEGTNLQVRYNEPYSGLSGLIFSAQHHGVRHGRRYLELELNNKRLRTTDSCESVARSVTAAIEQLLEDV